MTAEAWGKRGRFKSPRIKRQHSGQSVLTRSAINGEKKKKRCCAFVYLQLFGISVNQPAFKRHSKHSKNIHK